MMLAGALYRFDTYLVAFTPGRGLVRTSRACPSC